MFFQVVGPPLNLNLTGGRTWRVEHGWKLHGFPQNQRLVLAVSSSVKEGLFISPLYQSKLLDLTAGTKSSPFKVQCAHDKSLETTGWGQQRGGHNPIRPSRLPRRKKFKEKSAQG